MSSTAVVTEPNIETEYPICEHVRDNGLRCGSPALRGRHFCFHHSRAHAPGPRLGHRHYRSPLPETIESLQILIQQVTETLGSGPITEKAAGKLLYAVQLSTNLLKMQTAAQLSARQPKTQNPQPSTTAVACDEADPTVPRSSDHQIVRSPNNDVVTEISEAMLQVLAPPQEDPELADPDRPRMAASVPIEPHVFSRITGQLMTDEQIRELRPVLLTGDEDPGYEEAIRLMNAHSDACSELEELGMSTQHPRLRKWFPKVSLKRYIEPTRKS